MYSVNNRVADYIVQKFIELWGAIKWSHYYNGKFQDPFIINGQIQKAEKQYRHNWIRHSQQQTE